MARPRVFVSSTYYDLKVVRADLERFIKERGFEPVLHERGAVAYGAEKKLEEYCYKEIEHCDIIISIVGGRYGSPSKEKDYSISQQELKTAIELNKQIYVFVEKNVLAEHKTYEKNRDNAQFKPAAVDDLKIYKFLDEVFALPFNNQVAGFEITADITGYLQEQWAGLFQRLLQENARQKELLDLADMKEMIATLKQLVSFLTSAKERGDAAIREILLGSHPIFNQLKKMLKIPYRIYFTNKSEFEAWLRARGFSMMVEELWDSPNFIEWTETRGKKIHLLKFNKSIFDAEGRLKIFTPEEWKEADLKLDVLDAPDENVPF